MKDEVAAFIPENYTKQPESGVISWSSPSNIALVKYWGKRDVQIPQNPSLSFTLQNCKTITNLEFGPKTAADKFQFEVYLDGKRKESFDAKIQQFFERVKVYLPFLNKYYFKIDTQNTFPHSSGIASSASGMSALACCLVDLENKLMNEPHSDSQFNLKASFLARLGSGSACRSVEGPVVSWGQHSQIPHSSNLYGTTFKEKLHPIFKNYRDTILLVDKGEKQVSSTVGHNLMNGHPYATNRFQQAGTNLSKLYEILQSGDLKQFIELVESEALTLHAMMMTSFPYFILMKPNTLEIIKQIWDFRKNTGSSLCFTLDAGANVHLLYPQTEEKNVLEFIENQLAAYCQNGQFIVDQVGLGATRLI